MFKKPQSFAAFILLAGITSSVSAQIQKADNDMGIKVGIGFDQGFGVTAQFEDRLNVFIGNDGIATDYLLKEGTFELEVPINWYVGVGAVINWGNSYHYYDADGASQHKNYNHYSVRVPLGLSYDFAKNWHVYGQAAPDLAYRDKPHDSHFKFGVDFGLGIRYAF